MLFTARDGATLSGHVWATVAGPAKRPGIVITNGSVQADEEMYWYAAQTLAKAGYVVLTFDPQGQGQSDTYGQSPDQNEGVPAQTDGRPFYAIPATKVSGTAWAMSEPAIFTTGSSGYSSKSAVTPSAPAPTEETVTSTPSSTPVTMV